MLVRARDINGLYSTRVNFIPWDAIGSGVVTGLGGAWDAITGNDKKKQEEAAKAAANEERKKMMEMMNSNVKSEKSNKLPLYLGIGGGAIALIGVIAVVAMK